MSSYGILWKHFISCGRNFIVWRRRTYSWVLDFVDCPTHEIKKIQNYYLQFLTGAKLRINTETGSIAKLRISEWICLLSYVTPEDIDPRQPVNVFTAESHQTTFMTPNCQLACHLRDYIYKDVRDAGSFKGLIEAIDCQLTPISALCKLTHWNNRLRENQAYFIKRTWVKG